MEPLYTRLNCKFCFPLQWGAVLFWRSEQQHSEWLPQLSASLEADGIRVLRHRFLKKDASQFALSTQPDVSPERIIQRLKGRLQYCVSREQPKPFRRNFSLRSFGSQQREVIEKYIQGQVEHHQFIDPEFQEQLKSIQIKNDSVDLSKPRMTSHGIYWYDLHVVLVHGDRWRAKTIAPLQAEQQMVLKVEAKKGWAVSRGSFLPDHLHLAIRCNFDDAPDEVALCLLNNLAYAYGMVPAFQHSAYIGTIGEYDNRVVN